jgi:hypothetical protein
MKRIISVLILVIAVSCLFSVSPAFAYADEVATPVAGDYLKVLGSDVTLANIYDVNQLFNLPQTYYVKLKRVLSDGTTYLVEYNGITGKVANGATSLSPVSSSDLYIVAETNAYLSLTLALANDADFTPVDDFFSVGSVTTVSKTETLTFTYFGSFTLDTTSVAFVKNNETSELGYIATSNLVTNQSRIALADYEIPLHLNSRPVVTNPIDETPEETEVEPSNDNKAVRTLLIVGIVIPALIIIFLLFKPAKRKNYDYNRNRGYDTGPSMYDQPRRPRYDDRYSPPYYEDRDRYYSPRPRYDDRGYNDRYYDDRRYDDRYDDRR